MRIAPRSPGNLLIELRCPELTTEAPNCSAATRPHLNDRCASVRLRHKGSGLEPEAVFLNIIEARTDGLASGYFAISEKL